VRRTIRGSDCHYRHFGAWFRDAVGQFLKKGPMTLSINPLSKKSFTAGSTKYRYAGIYRSYPGRFHKDYLTGLYNRRYFFDLGKRFLKMPNG